MENKLTHIDTESVAERFQKHLDIEENFRIIFSGKFGVGKSYFLNNFFDDRNDQYNKILISPVNYVVSTNEDIFELIKADIIKELFLSNGITLETLKKNTKLQNISQKMEMNPFFLLRFMSRLLGKVNPIIETPEKLLSILEEIFNTYKSATKDGEGLKTNSKTIAEYLYETNEKKGSIYEDNYITKIINYFLEQIKAEKKNILIIDDFDRIDPEHIFRILNVLSAHNNYMGEANKFSFDHVIIVCDIANIKNIFQHRYGLKVDFEGYMDKFYSTDFFHYSNIDAIVNYVGDTFENTSSSYKEFAIFFLKILVKRKYLSLRMLLKHKYNINFNDLILYEQSGLKENVFSFFGGIPQFIANKRLFFTSGDLAIIQFFKLMSIFFGDLNSFYNYLLLLAKTSETIDYAENLNLLNFVVLQEHISTKDGDDIFFKKVYGMNGEARILEAAEYPTIQEFGRNYQIALSWNNGNRYFADKSYFTGATLGETTNSFGFPNKETSVKLSVLFDIIKAILLKCSENGYLYKAGINFKEE